VDDYVVGVGCVGMRSCASYVDNDGGTGMYGDDVGVGVGCDVVSGVGCIEVAVGDAMYGGGVGVGCWCCWWC